jgi:Flp pilus assembly protein TadG
MKAHIKSRIVTSLPWRALLPRRLCEETGNAAVEFIFVAVMFFTFLCGIMGFSMLMFSDLMTSEAAREGARYAMVRGNSWTTDCTTPGPANCTAQQADIETYAKSVVVADPDNLHLSATWLTSTGAGCGTTDGCKSAGSLVKVTATYSYTFALPLLPNWKFPMSSTAQTVVAQ